MNESRAEFGKFRRGKLWSPHEVKAAWAAWDAQETRHTENARELEHGNEELASLMDKVTMLVGRITRSDFGEHEFDNDPWQNAVDALEQLAPNRAPADLCSVCGHPAQPSLTINLLPVCTNCVRTGKATNKEEA